MKRVGVKRFTGLLLILLAVCLLVLWEAKGREIILMDEVLAAKQYIPSSEQVNESMFYIISVPVNAKIEDAFTVKDKHMLEGMVSSVPIYKGGQVSSAQLRPKTSKEIEEDSFFVLEKGWIAMRSSALRRGDIVEVLSNDSMKSFGKYKIAFVKNEKDEEVTDLTGVDLGISSGKGERTNSSSEIDHIEIVASLEEYMAIKTYVLSDFSASLILVQREK